MRIPARPRADSSRSKSTPLAAAIGAALLSALVSAGAAAQDDKKDVAELSDMEVTEDPTRMLPNESSSSSFGFNKPLIETPRSVSFISSEVIEKVGLSAVEDLARVAPGVFTTTRFGVQGGIDVRNVSADTYFRGMKRVTLQGNGRSVLAAMDTIEIVKGPPSPIFGMGRIGGYTNMYPKSGRAKTGTYLTQPQGFAQGISGSYNRKEVSGGVGGPINVLGKDGGYFLYGLYEDSHSFYDGVPVTQRVIQASTSLDNFVGPFRFETGGAYQVSDTAGALTGRFSQGIVDNGRVVTGTALKNLDLNGNGSIGYLELHSASPVTGGITSNNQPLIQTFNWQIDPATGRPRSSIQDFVTVPGIPTPLLTYLNANPAADPTGLVRAAGASGTGPRPGPTANLQVPIGMALDPRTTGYATMDLHRAGAYERHQHARMLTAYADLVYDVDPNFTLKNQMFFDELDQFKISNQPGCCAVHSRALEEKITATLNLSEHLPQWLRINSLASLNVRYVVAHNGGNAGNDYGTHRTDVTAGTWDSSLGGMTPNTTFVTAFDNPDLLNDGNPFGRRNKSTDLQTGVGMQFDVDMFSKLNLLIGGRWDGSDAENVDEANGFNPTTGTSANPGRFFTVEDKASDYDSGTSWSASLSYQLPYNIRPYVTYANSSVALDGNNNTYSNAVLRGPVGHIGQAYLKEGGIKASAFHNKLFFSTAVYEQNRTDVSSVDPNDPSLGVDATSTETRGWEMEIKVVPFKNASASFYALSQKTIYVPNLGGTVLVDARALGFQDVVDANGNVIYPAEAFLYGGRARVLLPAGMEEYKTKQGNPPRQMGMNLDYQTESGYGVTLSGNYFASTYSGRLKLVRLPEAYLFNLGLYKSLGSWEFKADVNNVLNRRWFRARTGDTLGDVLAQAMPDRKLQISAKVKF